MKRDLEARVEPVTRGDPESPLRWTCKSVRQLANELKRAGHRTSHRMVAELLHQMDYSLQANRKTLEGSSHPDRDAQFHHISGKIREFQADRQPVISVDRKKKELVGDYKNNGRELRPKGNPEKVRVHDFVIPELGRAAPYGVYDVTQNAGWVSVGVDHDTAAFAAQSIRRWWESMGSEAYPEAGKLLITADSGGSNGARRIYGSARTLVRCDPLQSRDDSRSRIGKIRQCPQDRVSGARPLLRQPKSSHAPAIEPV